NGWKASYVTQLKAANRLVLTPDRRRVLVADSLRLIEDTRDPSKAGVAARHAAARGSANPSPSIHLEAEQGGPGGDDDADDRAPVAPNDPLALRRARAQAEIQEAALRKALREEQQELGELLQRDDVLAM